MVCSARPHGEPPRLAVSIAVPLKVYAAARVLAVPATAASANGPVRCQYRNHGVTAM